MQTNTPGRTYAPSRSTFGSKDGQRSPRPFNSRSSFGNKEGERTSSSRSNFGSRNTQSTPRPFGSRDSKSTSRPFSQRSSFSNQSNQDSNKSYSSQSGSGSRDSQSTPRPYGQRSSFGSRDGQRSHSNFSNGPRRFSSRPSGKRRGEQIDISRFVRNAVDSAPEKPVEITHTFADFNLCEEIQNNLRKKLFATPTPIQDQAILPIMEGRDLVGLANTGTGKTGAFLLPLINKVYKNKSEKVLIIAPTRELAIQIENEFREFSWGMKLFSAICVGGSPIFKQINNLRRNPNFVIGTPGRLKDLSDRNLVKFESFTNIVLDEVDRMLDMGFVDEIKAILDVLPSDRQSLFFSATIPPKIRELVTRFLNDPVSIAIKTGETAQNVEQDIVRVRDRAVKFNQLQEILKQDELKKVLIFIETKMEVERLTQNLIGEGFRAESLHGDKKQNQRLKALTQFRNNSINILVATDVAARGLDIKDISHVINYTVPQTYDDYIHRIGRTGRGDKKGKALTFVEAR